MRPPENLRTMYALPSELAAIEEVVVDYLHILSVTRAPQESAQLAGQLQSFLLRCQDALEALRAGREEGQPIEKANFVPIHVPSWEILAFGTASIGYVQFWRHDLGPARRDVITRVLAVQARYTGSLSRTTLSLSRSGLHGDRRSGEGWHEGRW
jgi:hypothetical protein